MVASEGDERMNYALIVLFSFAITVVFTRGSIFEPLRQHGPELWRDLVKCPLCSGVWVGGAAAVLCLDLYALPLRYATFLVLGLGSLSGCAALLFVRVWDALESFAVLLELEAEGRKRWEELQKAQEAAREKLRAAARGDKPQGPDVVLVKDGQFPKERPAPGGGK